MQFSLIIQYENAFTQFYNISGAFTVRHQLKLSVLTLKTEWVKKVMHFYWMTADNFGRPFLAHYDLKVYT